jgi:hypothetical protein
VRIRPAHQADWPDVLAINTDGVPGVSRLDAAELARLAAVATCFRVAELGGAVRGYCLALHRQTTTTGRSSSGSKSILLVCFTSTKSLWPRAPEDDESHRICTATR